MFKGLVANQSLCLVLWDRASNEISLITNKLYEGRDPTQ